MTLPHHSTGYVPSPRPSPVAVLGTRRRTGPMFVYGYLGGWLDRSTMTLPHYSTGHVPSPRPISSSCTGNKTADRAFGFSVVIPGRMAGRRLDRSTMTLAMSSTSSARSARLLAGPVWGQDGGQGLMLLCGHTWEDGGEEAGPLNYNAGHVQHQLGQVRQAARRTRLGQEPDKS
jgi:hypothetical protein